MIDHVSELKQVKAAYQAAVYKKKLEIFNKYDVLDDRNRHQRKQPRIEIEDEDKQMTAIQRAYSYNMTRDLQRNFTSARAHINQLCMHSMGCGPKLNINLEDEKSKKATEWFNGVYAKECDSRDDTPLGEIYHISLQTILRDGAYIVAFDDFLHDDGKLMFWEADQFANVDAKEWEKTELAKKGFKQSNGVITDPWGRVFSYAVSSERGKLYYKNEEYTILPPGVARMMKRPMRFNQKTGISEILTASAHYQDIYEAVSSELQTLKSHSKRGGVFIKNSDFTGFDAEEELALDNGEDPEAIIDGADTEVVAGEKSNDNYEHLETLAGGYIDYLQKGEDFKLLSSDRPNMNFKEFVDWMAIMNGASIGLYSCFSTGRVSTSYTAFRGEQILTWPTFYFWQKFHERRFGDWHAKKTINWGARKGRIELPPDGWESRLSYIWPSMQEVDLSKHADAIDKLLKAGQSNFRELLGPNWKQKLLSLSEETKFALAEGMTWMSIFESKSGAPMPTEKKQASDDSDASQSWVQKIRGFFK
jgi:capsid protein